MLTATLTELYKRDLNALIQEIEGYNSDAAMWATPEGISNSAGNLCLHLVGNLNHFIGAVLGDTGYVRQRDLEFSQTDVPVETLVRQVEETIRMVDIVLSKLNATQLHETYPLEVFGKPMTTEFFLMHLATHVSYHLGQINYHRRLVDA